jgi:hypothetical protein
MAQKLSTNDDNDDLTIQLLSDVHLDDQGLSELHDRTWYWTPWWWTIIPLAAIRDTLETVFFVLGNHEPYGSSFVSSKKRLSDFCTTWEVHRDNVSSLGELVVLDQSRYDINEEVTVLGCKLSYSNIDPEQYDDVKTNWITSISLKSGQWNIIMLRWVGRCIAHNRTCQESQQGA